MAFDHHVLRDSWSSQQPIPINHPLVPEEVRSAFSKSLKSRHLYRVETFSSVEWWLMDADGELLDIFWIDGGAERFLARASSLLG